MTNYFISSTMTLNKKVFEKFGYHKNLPEFFSLAAPVGSMKQKFFEFLI